MVKLNKYLILMQMVLLNLICQNIIQSATTIQTEQSVTKKLIEAVHEGNKEKVEELIKAGANVNAKDNKGNTPLFLAVFYGHKGIVESLIKANADLNVATQGSTALMLATLKGLKEIAELLLKAGAKIEPTRKDSKSAIDSAKISIWDSETIKKNKQEIVKMLEGEQTRRESVVKKWIEDKLAKEITESTSGQLFSDISKIAAEYIPTEYTDLPLEYRLAG